MVHFIYLISALLFIFGIKKLNRVRSARSGNLLALLAMMIAISIVLFDIGFISWKIIASLAIGTGIGILLALKVQMTAMPQLVAMFNGVGGLASCLVAWSVYWKTMVTNPQWMSLFDRTGFGGALTIPLSIFIGIFTFSGSVIAYLKLNNQLKRNQVIFNQRAISIIIFISIMVLYYFCSSIVWTPWVCITFSIVFIVFSGILGVLLVVPIGGADMPVVIALLNSYSGLAAASTGFVLQNQLLIVSGALVGASGLILTQIMCKAMNRSLWNVLFGGTMQNSTQEKDDSEYQNIKSYSAEEAALVFDSATNLIIVPGYGLAVAQAQHSIRELADLLESKGILVRYAIHPVAGRMPGHMNVLLAEANVSYDKLFEMEKINSEFKNTDIVLVLGANDVVNPSSREDESSPIYGMPILNVDEARSIIVVKRSLSPGYAGVKNSLFENDKTMMLFGDAKVIVDQLISEVKENL